MAKNLVIVESPAKAKTISKYLGSDFTVKSSFGHIRDLEKEGMGIDIENQFQPRYMVSKDKKKIVSELKTLAKSAKEVWLATDEDREGEAISWHLCEVLKLDPKTTKRIVFHEITKSAILKAVEHPRTVDMNLVDAQQARRILDRLVGFEISPVLWRKLSGGSSLSAGRVQSVAVRLIVERERAIIHFEPVSFYKTEALFHHPNSKGNFKAEGQKHVSGKKAEHFLTQCIAADFKVEDLQVKPGKRTPAAPFTTSTLQQEASRKLGMSVSRTMRVAQSLYENGHITYMRTDSVNLSQTALQQAEEVIKEHYGKEYHKRRHYKTKSQSAQEAHEAIRPTNLSRQFINDPQGKSLYNLIWKRTIASQMADAVIERTTVKIGISTVAEEQLTATGEVLTFEGFIKVYREGHDEDQEEEQSGILPPLKIGDLLDLQKMTATQKFSKPQARFTEASLVKKLEELGIGRPSTYAPTISTIQHRKYVEKGNRDGLQRKYEEWTLEKGQVKKVINTETYGTEKAKLFPTDLGMVVTDFLMDHFPKVMDYQFTANIEDEFDKIAGGKKVWNEVIDRFYTPFHETVEDTMENAEREKGQRELGQDPASGKPVYARLGRFGPMVQIGDAEDEEKPRFASLKHNQSLETITLEEALDLFKLPFDLNNYEGKPVMIGTGRFGPYVKWGDQFISIPKGEDPLEVDQERAIAIIEEKKKADAPIAKHEGKPVTKGVGRFGPYLKWEGMFVNVPKAYDFDNLSQEDIDTLIKKKVEKEVNRYILKFPEEKITVENGRWGPFIRVGRKMVSLGKKEDGEKYQAEDVKDWTIDQVLDMIKKLKPELLVKKKSKTKKSGATKKSSTAKKAKEK